MFLPSVSTSAQQNVCFYLSIFTNDWVTHAPKFVPSILFFFFSSSTSFLLILFFLPLQSIFSSTLLSPTPCYPLLPALSLSRSALSCTIPLLLLSSPLYDYNLFYSILLYMTRPDLAWLEYWYYWPTSAVFQSVLLPPSTSLLLAYRAPHHAPSLPHTS